MSRWPLRDKKTIPARGMPTRSIDRRSIGWDKSMSIRAVTEAVSYFWMNSDGPDPILYSYGAPG